MGKISSAAGLACGRFFMVGLGAHKTFNLKVALLAIIAATGPAHAQLQTWGVGEERELHAGYYTKVLAKKDGWVTFQIESQKGQRCATVKPETGQPVPEPYKNLIVVYGKPHVELGRRFTGDRRPIWRIDGPYTGGAEWRVKGDRFMTAPAGLLKEGWNDDLSVDGKVIEYTYEGWEYPNIFVGRESHEGEIDMTGLGPAMKRHLKLCEGG